MAKCNCLYEPFCSMLNGEDIVLPTPCKYRKDPANHVEVVRCKDCWRWHRFIDTYGTCHTGHCFVHDTRMAESDFCSYGERRPNV